MERMQKSFSEFAIPQEEEIEYRVLAELVADDHLFANANGVLTRDCFYQEDCQKAYDILKGMSDARERVDLITASKRLDKKFFLDHIASKCDYASEASFMSHCAILNSVSQRRRLYFACVKGIQMSCSNMVSDDEILNLPSKLSEEMTRGAYRNSTQRLSDVINEVREALESGVSKRVPTGFPSLDRLCYGGFNEGNLVVLAARPSVGKTAFMLQMARESSGRGIPSLALSLEMTNNELAQRLLFSTHYINALDVASGRMNWSQFELAAGKFENHALYMDETPQTLEEVCATITIAHQRGQCEIAFVDYLQLMASPESRNSLYQQVTETTKRMKKLAKNLKIPIVLLCQLNRNSVAENRPPQMHDLRDSGSIEQDADIVLMLERLKDSEGVNTNRVNMYVRKNRGGLAGDITIEVESDNTYTNFKELTNYD